MLLKKILYTYLFYSLRGKQKKYYQNIKHMMLRIEQIISIRTEHFDYINRKLLFKDYKIYLKIHLVWL